MKHLLFIFILALVVAGCSKEDAAPAPAEEATIEPEPAAEPKTAEDDTEQTLVVVEESAADLDPQDAAIVLARADTPQVARSWKFKEGEHFTRMVPTQPTVGGADKIEVAEAFMYSCPHCESLEPYINRWAEDKDADVRFVRIPVIFNQIAQLHAQLYYTEEVLGRNGLLLDAAGFRKLVFDEYHRRGNRLTSVDAIQRLFTRSGVSEEDFAKTWSSFEVNQKLRVGADLARRYNVASVPMVVVNGKYRTDVSMAGGPAELIAVIDELTAREGLR